MLLVILMIPVLVIGFLVYASFNVRSGVYVKAFCSASPEKKQIAVSFDDGPHSIYTPLVLDVLAKYNIKATFFLIGKNIPGNEEILQRMVREGHQIGNHSYSHGNTFPVMNTPEMAGDLLLCEQMIEESTGYQVKWFRPPFGVTNPMVAAAVKERGYLVAGWNIRSLDTVKTTGNVIRKIKSRIKPGAIILLHDHLPGCTSVLEDILPYAGNEGYSMVTIEELFDSK